MASKRKRVRVMKQVLRNHGAPVPKRKGCLPVMLVFMSLATAAMTVAGHSFMGLL